jgi:hypothetical protein
MAGVNEISGLCSIAVKPLAWRVIEGVDATFTIKFTYVDVDRNDWAEIRTRRDEVKNYKKIETALFDIKKVQNEATVFFEFN